MPFTLTTESIKEVNGHLKVLGKIESGAFFGGEEVELCTNDGESIVGIIESYALKYPVGHPVTPEHTQTRIFMTICTSKQVDISRLLNQIIGRGTIGTTIEENKNKIDISNQVNNPIFWGCHFYDLMLGQDGDCMSEELLGIKPEEINQYYLDIYSKNYENNNWLVVKFDIDKLRSIEIEYTCGVEYQTRYWIKYKDDKVLLGYESSHFSLPGIRLSEIERIADLFVESKNKHLALLLLPCCFLCENESLDDLEKLFNMIPNKQSNQSLLNIFKRAKNKNNRFKNHLNRFLVVSGVAWQEDKQLGWINNWMYSQRNPNSAMRVINDEDYEIIKIFFR